MKIVLQRVSSASVTVENEVVGEIGLGYVALLGVSNSDTKENVDKLVDKIAKMRIFADENGKTNLSSSDVNGEILVISQFTLYADLSRGNRPSFTSSGSPELAKKLYEYFLLTCEGKFKKVAGGSFGEHMHVSLSNDGPFTLVLEL